MATVAPEIPALARDRAFERLYRRYAKDVYRYALALLRNPADAEDVTQTTFMNAYRAFQRGELIEKPHNWLIKIAHNAARTRYARASCRVKEVPLEDHLDQLAVSEEDKPDVYAVLDALGRLPLNQRAALVMRELEGRTYAEIGDTLGVSVAAVETLIFRGRRSLRLKASAVRVLGAVQLPTSLAQLFNAGGGIVAGGGAVVGTGFLFKAALAIVAGIVATGVDGDHNAGTAAARPLAPSASLRAQSPTLGRNVAQTPAAAVIAVRGARPGVLHGGSIATSRRPADDSGMAALPTAVPMEVAAGAVAGPNAPPASPTTSTEATAATAATTTTQTVTGSVDSVTAAVPPPPALPVSVPQLPPPPVQLPPPPPLPAPSLP
jgi:RNA polymerase sigma factor (sigma-70 family)